MTRSEEEQLQRMLATGRSSVANRGPQPIAEILSRLMTRRGYAHEQMSLEWGTVWGAVAGLQASDSRPGRFTRGVLEIIVRNSTVVQELTFRKKQLLRGVQEQIPHVQVRDLRFRVGDVS